MQGIPILIQIQPHPTHPINSSFRAIHLPSQRRRRDSRHRREVRRQSGHRHRLDDRAHRHVSPVAPALVRSSRFPTTPARATGRSASAGISRSLPSRARPTRASRSIRMPTSPMSSSSPVRKIWCRVLSQNAGGQWVPEDRSLHERSTAQPIASSATARASKGCSPASSAGRIKLTRQTPSGARSPKTTSRPGTAKRRRAALPIRPTQPASSAG